MPSAADKVVSIIFQGDDRVTKTIKGVRSSLGSLEGAIKGVADPFARIGDGVLAADAALTAFAIGGLTYAYKKSSDFEAASAELAKVLGDEIDLLGEAQSLALELSSQYGATAESVLASTAAFKQAGFDVQGAMQLTRSALDLAIAGELEAAQASEILVAALKGFRAPAEDATRLVDVLNEVSNNYATNVEELGIAMAGISPIASQMGFSMEETAGLVTPVIEVFRSGSEASRALKTGLLKLLDDTPAVADALERLGVAQTDANGKLRSGRDILLDVSKAFQTAEESDKLFLTQQLVGIDQSARMVTVFDNLAKTTDITATAMNAAGSAMKEVEIRLGTAEVATQRFGQAFQNAAIVMGDQFRDAATEAVEGGTELLGAIREITEAGTFDPLFNAIEGYGRELGAFLSGIAKAMPEAFESVDWDDLLDAIDDLVGQFGRLFDGVDLTTAEGLGDAMQGVVDTLESLVKVTEGMVRYLDPVWDSIREGAARFNELDESSKLAAGEFLGAAELVVKAGVRIGGALVAIEKSGANIKDVFNVVAGSVGFVWNELQITFSRMAQLVVNFLRVATLIPEKLSGIIPGFDGINKGISSFRDGLELMNDELQSQVGKNSEEAVNRLAQAWGGLSGEARAASRSMKGVGESAQETASITSSAVGESADDIMRHVQAMMDGTAESAAEGAKKATQELDKGIPPEKAVSIKPEVDAKAQEEAKKAIEDLAKREERLQELEIARMEGDTERYKALMGVQGEKIKAYAETEQTALETLQEGIGESGKAITDLLGELSSMGPYSSGRAGLLKELERQVDSAKTKEELQARLLEAQTKIAEARAERAQSGDDVMIQIDGAGLQPHLEAFMYEILEAIQVRATEEGASFLLGT